MRNISAAIFASALAFGMLHAPIAHAGTLFTDGDFQHYQCTWTAAGSSGPGGGTGRPSHPLSNEPQIDIRYNSTQIIISDSYGTVLQAPGGTPSSTISVSNPNYTVVNPAYLRATLGLHGPFQPNNPQGQVFNTFTGTAAPCSSCNTMGPHEGATITLQGSLAGITGFTLEVDPLVPANKSIDAYNCQLMPGI